MRKENQTGTLLLEVLMGAAVLAIGILACLRIFSASIYSSGRLMHNQQILATMDSALFDLFLDPLTFDSSKQGTLRTDDPLLAAQLQIEPMVKPVTEEDKKAGKAIVPQLKNLLSIEFNKVRFIAKYGKQPSEQEREFYLFSYGKRKKI